MQKCSNGFTIVQKIKRDHNKWCIAKFRENKDFLSCFNLALKKNVCYR